MVRALTQIVRGTGSSPVWSTFSPKSIMFVWKKIYYFINWKQLRISKLKNLWNLTPSTNWCVFIQSLLWSRCASPSPSGFPENSGLKWDQFKCTMCGTGCCGACGTAGCCGACSTCDTTGPAGGTGGGGGGGAGTPCTGSAIFDFYFNSHYAFNLSLNSSFNCNSFAPVLLF